MPGRLFPTPVGGNRQKGERLRDRFAALAVTYRCRREGVGFYD